MTGVTVNDLLKIMNDIPEAARDDVFVYVSGAQNSVNWSAAGSAEFDEMATCGGGIIIHLP